MPETPTYSAGEWEYDESTGQVDVPDGTICVGITWRPNGHLIEAAPALMEALVEARAFDDPGDTWPTPARKAILAKMDAAIAKARGQ